MYVDDSLLVDNALGLLRETKDFLSINFEVKYMVDKSYAIEIEILCDISHGLLKLSQKSIIERVLEIFNMNNYSAGIVPIKKGTNNPK